MADVIAHARCGFAFTSVTYFADADASAKRTNRNARPSAIIIREITTVEEEIMGSVPALIDDDSERGSSRQLDKTHAIARPWSLLKESRDIFGSIKSFSSQLLLLLDL